LKQDGIVKVSGLIAPDELLVMRREFDGFVRHMDK